VPTARPELSNTPRAAGVAFGNMNVSLAVLKNRPERNAASLDFDQTAPPYRDTMNTARRSVYSSHRSAAAINETPYRSAQALSSSMPGLSTADSLIGRAHPNSVGTLPADTVCTDEFNILLNYEVWLKLRKLRVGIRSMAKVAFVPKLSREEAHILCRQYDVDGEFWFENAGRCIARGEYQREHFDAIFAWKTNNRGKSRPEKNANKAIERGLKVVIKEVDRPRVVIETLTKLSGVGIPVASAIMSAVFPERFTIIDFRALDALSAEKLSTASINRYLEYVEFCKRLANRWGLSLRDLDRALWKWSEKHGAKLVESISDHRRR
jgi:hypothetical protein